MATNSKRTPTSYRFSDQCREMITEMAEWYGVSTVSVLEIAVRAMHRSGKPSFAANLPGAVEEVEPGLAEQLRYEALTGEPGGQVPHPPEAEKPAAKPAGKGKGAAEEAKQAAHVPQPAPPPPAPPPPPPPAWPGTSPGFVAPPADPPPEKPKRGRPRIKPLPDPSAPAKRQGRKSRTAEPKGGGT